MTEDEHLCAAKAKHALRVQLPNVPPDRITVNVTSADMDRTFYYVVEVDGVTKEFNQTGEGFRPRGGGTQARSNPFPTLDEMIAHLVNELK